MATIRPFMAIRPAFNYADQVAALPYDVMNSEEKRNGKGQTLVLPACR